MWTTANRKSGIISGNRIFSFQGWVLTEIFEIEVAQSGFCEVGILDVGIRETSSCQHGVLENGSSQRASLEACSVNDSVREVCFVEVRLCVTKKHTRKNRVRRLKKAGEKNLDPSVESFDSRGSLYRTLQVALAEESILEIGF